ncbi:MAG TPA: glycoside hydrolase family 13 protein [Candidatus Limnocylindrales bacterium]
MTTDTPDWVRDAVFYQIFPDRFAASGRVVKPGPLEAWDAPPTIHGFKGGDLLGIAERLPYLADLGVNALYLTPIFASAANHRYHTYDYFRVDPLLGGDDALRELLDAAHGRGMRVVLDGVFNHTGRGFWAFHHVVENGAASPYRNWFHFDDAALATGKQINPYPRRRVPAEQLGYEAWWGMPALPKLNVADPGVRAHLLEAAEHWIRFGIDGWRLDVPEEIRDETFWLEFRAQVRAANPEAYLVGEIWHVAPEWLAGDRFDGLMNYPLAEAILSFAGAGHLDEPLLRSHHEYGPRVQLLDGAAFAARVSELHAAYRPEAAAAQLNLLDSHDSPRFHSLVRCDRASYRLAVLLQATLPGAPCIYYGDEIGLEGGLDPDSRRAFPWDESRWDVELLSFVRAAIAMRHAEAPLRRGELRVLAATGAAFAFERSIAAQRLIIAVNAGDNAERLSLPVDADVGSEIRSLSLPGWASAGRVGTWDGGVEIEIDGRAGAVFRLP